MSALPLLFVLTEDRRSNVADRIWTVEDIIAIVEAAEFKGELKGWRSI